MANVRFANLTETAAIVAKSLLRLYFAENSWKAVFSPPAVAVTGDTRQ